MSHRSRPLHPLLRGLLALAAFVPALALAHTGAEPHAHAGTLASAWAGFVHPFSGLDHLLAMLAVGVWSAQAVRPRWVAPAAFVALMTVGALAGMAGLRLSALEPMLAASLLVLGLLVARRSALPWMAAATVAGAFALVHGLAHGTELPGAGATLAGMVAATALLHGAGLALGHWVLNARWARVASGSGIALAGVGLLAQAF